MLDITITKPLVHYQNHRKKKKKEYIHSYLKMKRSINFRIWALESDRQSANQWFLTGPWFHHRFWFEDINSPEVGVFDLWVRPEGQRNQLARWFWWWWVQYCFKKTPGWWLTMGIFSTVIFRLPQLSQHLFPLSHLFHSPQPLKPLLQQSNGRMNDYLITTFHNHLSCFFAHSTSNLTCMPIYIQHEYYKGNLVFWAIFLFMGIFC